ncbi:hypothetical protein [Aeromicrobium sp. 179-A 4D2 NHS]|uniref:hypothetical protein n=1 Tax=Aeromicrobium sp. 179-A 4D2 NHS TaxID=3142375 RepID=UPI0039A3032F
MTTFHVGLVADPAFPSEVAEQLGDLDPPRVQSHDAWEVDRVSEPFTTGSEDAETAMGRLLKMAQERRWDVVVGMTELPLHDSDGRHLVARTDDEQHVALVSLPALGGLRVRARARRLVRSIVSDMSNPSTAPNDRVTLSHVAGPLRLLLGMVLANRPWLLVPGLKSALVAALATGAVATINSTVWLLASSLSPWRLTAATVAALAIVVCWLIIDGNLWDRPDDESIQARKRSRMYNASTIVSLTVGVTICYVVLFLINLLWALFVLDPAVTGGYIRKSMDHGDLVLLAWFVASAATVGGGLGSGLESDEAIRAAAYSKREEERRGRIADEDS